MARSYSVYVVNHPGIAAPIAAFTVKHELLSWLRRWQTNLSDLDVYRIRDGATNASTRMGSALEVLNSASPQPVVTPEP